MGFFDDIFGEGSSFPDYRDRILFNGRKLYIATGVFRGTKMEMYSENNRNETIWFNVNVDKNKYSDFHNQYDLFRLIEHVDFTNHGVTQGTGNRYYPTGRLYYNDAGQLWELMKQDDPSDVLFLKMPSYSDDQFIFGENCL